MNDDGSMARMPELDGIRARHGLKIGTIADLIHYRSETEKLVERVAERAVATPYGTFRLCVYHDKTVDEVHYALVKGEPAAGAPDAGARARALRVARHVRLRRIAPRLLGAGRDAHGRAPEGRRDRAPSRHETSEAILEPARRGRAPQAREPGRGIRACTASAPRSCSDLDVGRMRVLARPKRIPSMSGFGLEVVEYVSPEDAIAVKAAV